MNLKKTIALFGCAIPMLLSCDTTSIAGTYSFQLGKDVGTHIGVYLKLTDKDYQKDEREQAILEDGFKDFTISMSMQLPDSEDAEAEISDILSIFTDETGKATIPGYYKRSGSSTRTGEEILKFGFNFDYICEKFVDVYNKERGEEYPELTIDELQPILDVLYTDNMVRLIQSIAFATYKESKVNFYIPVSLEDVYYQLYWYGIDVKVTFQEGDLIPNIELDTSIPQHDFGTKPTKEEVDEINEHFKEDHQGGALAVYSKYRAFNQVKLTLVKE